MFRELENKLNGTEQNQNNIHVQASYQLNALQKEITTRENKITFLNDKIKEREMHVDAALVSNTLNKVNIKNLVEKNDDKDDLIAELKSQLSKTQKMLDDAVLERKSEGTALL